MWNIAGGVAILLLPDVLFTRQGLPEPQPPLYYQSWIALFMIFGVGYYMVSRNLHENRAIVVLGMVGKLAFAVNYGEVRPALMATLFDNAETNWSRH